MTPITSQPGSNITMILREMVSIRDQMGKSLKRGRGRRERRLVDKNEAEYITLENGI